MNAAEIARQGSGWAVAVVLASVVVFLFKAYIAEKDKRFQDQKENNVLYQTAMGEFSRTSELMLAKLSGEVKK